MPLTKVTPANLHQTVKTMVTTMVNETAVDSADVVTLINSNAIDSADANSLFDTRLATKDTGDLSEGSNLYYTDARADARADLRITNALNDSITITSTDAGSSAGPDLILYRNSASPADGDYIGQIQFKGRQDGPGDEIYAKVTGKISDASNSTEDGLIETAIKGNGSFTIVSRQRSDELQLINGVGLSVAGNTTLSGTLNNHTIPGGSGTFAITSDLYQDSDVGAYIAGNRTYGNITTTGYIAGPATMTIDPAAVGDNTGTLVVAGNLQVDGITTTINSTTVTVDDKTLVLGDGSTTDSQANGTAVVFGGQTNAASIYYTSATDTIGFANIAGIDVPGTVTATGGAANNDNSAVVISANSTQHAKIKIDTSSTGNHRSTLALESGSYEVNIATSGLDEMRFSTSNTSDALFIGSNGNVGIGTISPLGQLMVRDDTGGSATKIIISNNGTVQSGTTSRLSFYEGTTEQSYIERRRDGTGQTAFVTPADDNPFVFESNGSLGEFARFTSGKLGIGTISPDQLLHVASAAETVPVRVTSTGTDATIGYSNHVTPTGYNIRAGMSDDDDFSIWTNDTKRLTITSGGNVAIGATSTSYKFDVNGNARIRDQLSIIKPSTGTTKNVMQYWLHSGENTLNLNMYGGSTDLIQFAAANSEQNISIVTDSTANIDATNTTGIYIKSGGNVGIGTTSPDAKLEVSGNVKLGSAAHSSWTDSVDDLGGLDVFVGSGSHAFTVWDDNSQSTPRFIVERAGNVGIGVNSPTKRLDIRGGDVTIYGGVDGYNADSEEVRLWLGNNNAHIGAMFNYGLFFNPGNNAGKAMMIRQSTGNVGIGTTNPVSKLTVLDGVPGLESTTAGNISILYNGGENTYDRGGGIDFRQKWFNSSTDLVKTGMISGIKTYGNGNHGGGLSFYTKPHNGNNLQQTMVLSGNDRMGIGTQNPQAKLHVTAQAAANVSSAGSIDGGSINTSTGDIVTGRIFWEGIVGSGTNVFGVNNESGGLVVYNYSTSRYQIAFNNGQNIVFGQQSATGMYNGTGSNGFAVAQAGNGGQYVPIQNTSDSNLYLSKHSSYTDARCIQFSIGGATKGSVTVASTGTTYNTTSDLRLKTDIKPIENATDKLLSMNPVEHKWKADPKDDAVHGFIAQEMKEIIPEAVYGDPDGDEMMSMDYGRITPVIVAALQDALKEIKELKARINELESNK